MFCRLTPSRSRHLDEQDRTPAGRSIDSQGDGNPKTGSGTAYENCPPPAIRLTAFQDRAGSRYRNDQERAAVVDHADADLSDFSSDEYSPFRSYQLGEETE